MLSDYVFFILISKSTSTCLQAFVSSWLIYIPGMFLCVTSLLIVRYSVRVEGKQRELCVSERHRYRSVKAYECAREKTDLTV